MVVPGGPSPSWPEEIEQEFGRESDFYRSRVLAEFPSFDEENLIPLAWCEAAVERHERKSLKLTEEVVAGLDVARFGRDRTVLMIRAGPVVVHIQAWSDMSVLNTARRTAGIVQRFGIRPRPVAPARPARRGRIIVDAVGLGVGAAEKLDEMGFDVVFFNGGQQAGAGRFSNKRSEAVWGLRDRLSPDSGAIALPRHEQLIRELTAATWREVGAGKVLAGEKSAMKIRLGGKSPDFFDALALAFAPSPGRAHGFAWRI